MTKKRPASITAAFSAGLLLIGTLVIIFSGDMLRQVTGLPRSEGLSPPDDVKAAAHEDPMPFLITRDRLEFRVSTPMTVRQLLDNNRLNKPNLQRQVLEQLGNPPLDSMVAAGTTLNLALTPAAADVPATTHSGARP